MTVKNEDNSVELPEGLKEFLDINEERYVIGDSLKTATVSCRIEISKLKEFFKQNPSVSVVVLKKAFSEADFELGKEFDGKTIPIDIWKKRVLSKLGLSDEALTHG